MTRRAKSLADMSDEELGAVSAERLLDEREAALATLSKIDAECRRRQWKAEAEAREAQERAARWKDVIERPSPRFLNPRKVEPLVPFVPGNGTEVGHNEITCDRDGTRPSPAHASERGSLPDRVGASTLHAASEVAGAGDLEIPAFMRRTGGEG